MRRLKVPNSELIANPEGRTEILSFYNDIGDFAKRAGEILDGTITDDRMLVVQFVEDGDYPIFRNIPYEMEIFAVTSRCASGSCTATVKIGSTALGGTANSVSTSEQIQSHSSANEAAIGDDVKATISSNSSCEMMELSIHYRRTLIV